MAFARNVDHDFDQIGNIDSIYGLGHQDKENELTNIIILIVMKTIHKSRLEPTNPNMNLLTNVCLEKFRYHQIKR